MDMELMWAELEEDNEFWQLLCANPEPNPVGEFEFMDDYLFYGNQ